LGTALVLTGSQAAVAGSNVSDNAIRIGTGSYLTCYHNIAGNGGGTEVNEYSMVFDFKVSNISQWHCFYQANAGNSNDGELFINTSGQLGRSTAGPGYSSYVVVQNEWYRMVVSVDLGNYYRVYLDGALILAGGSLSVDGDYSLYPSSGSNLVHFFADNDGEDNEIDIAVAAIFDHPLNQTEVNSLGGYGHNIDPIPVGILPYLQTPTPTSMYVSWHSTQTSSTIVDYGTSSSLGLTQTGAVDDISGKKWHTVKLTGLSPDTEYFYRCTSGSEVSEIYSFKTPPQTPQQGQHLRYIIVSGWTWDFDNNGSTDSDVQDPNFIFTEPGFYTVKLTTANGVEIKDLYINVEENTVEVIENKSNDILRINPNPCSTYTNIEYYLKESGKVKITVLDSQGKAVSVLVDEVENFGKHSVSWEPKSNDGSRFSAGNYFIRFEHNGLTETKKVVVTEK
jgi:hypothetical protein